MSNLNILYKNMAAQTGDANIGVVGSSGNIGDPLLRILDKHSQASILKAFDMVPPRNEVSNRVRVYSGKDGDLTDLENVHEFMKDLDFVACAVGAPSSKIFEVEVGGIKNLVSAAIESGRVKQILYISVLGVGKKILEFQTTKKGKKQAEQHLIDSGIIYTIIRPSGYSFDLHRALMRQVTQGYVNAVANFDGSVQPIAARNVAEIIAAAIGNEKAYNQIFNVGGKEVFSRSALAEFYAKILNRRVDVRSLTEKEFKELYKSSPINSNVILHMVKTNSVMEQGDIQKLNEAFPGIEDLFIDYETRVRELLNER